MTPDERAFLRAHLLASGLCGETRTTRENTVGNAEKLADGDPDKGLGIGARGRSDARVMEAVAALCGCSPSLTERSGGGFIDPERTLDALAAMGVRLARAAREGDRMIVATGHPTGLLPMYQAVAGALAAAGAKVLTPIEDETLEPPAKRTRRRAVRYLDAVAVLVTGADLAHTHEAWPMEALLDAAGPVGLVLGDHGWAGAAIVRGVETVCFTDVNDPALAVAKADGLTDVVVPLDDNLPPATYEPLRDHLIARIAAGG